MDNKLLHQTLAELEDNLAQIESARNQVNQVSKKSEDLVVAFSNILKQLYKIEKENLFEDLDIKKKVESSLLKFKKDMQTISDGFLKENQQLSIGWKSELDGMSANLQKTQKSLQSFEKELKNTEKKVASIDMKADFEKLIADLVQELKAHTNLLENNVLTLKNQINSGFESSENQIQKIDSTKTVSQIEKKLEQTNVLIKNIEKDFLSKVEELKNDIDRHHNITTSKLNSLGNMQVVFTVALAFVLIIFFILIK